MRKLLTMILPISAVVIGTTPLMVGCGSGDQYDLSWTYIHTDKTKDQFVPSIPESDLPTDVITDMDDAVQLYVNDVTQNKKIMTDDFLNFGNRYIELYSGADQGSYVKSYITFTKVSLDTETYPSSMALLSFKFETRVHLVTAGVVVADQITKCEYINYPFELTKLMDDQPWMLQADASISEVKNDKNWTFSFYSYVALRSQPTKEKSGSFDYTVGGASQEEQQTFADNVQLLGSYSSYYLSKLTYNPES